MKKLNKRSSTFNESIEMFAVAGACVCGCNDCICDCLGYWDLEASNSNVSMNGFDGNDTNHKKIG